MSDIQDITSENWQKEVIEKEGLIIADFWAEWCGPCKNMNPILKALAITFDKKKAVQVDGLPIRFVKINIDENRDLAEQNNISSIPNLIFFRNGEKVHETVGSMPFGVLKETIENIARSL